MSVQVLRQRPSLWSFVLQSESFDQEEHFVDVDKGDENDSSRKGEVGWQNGEDVTSEEARVSEEAPASMDEPWTAYRVGHREPLYSKAETSSLWELAMVGWLGFCLYMPYQAAHASFFSRRWFTTIHQCKSLPKLWPR